jgi:hypothetical protein
MKRDSSICAAITSDWKRVFILFLLFWLVINVIQSIFTEMMSDEAYYFLYGENLAWGYYDHPPVVGLMTFISNLFFGGNLSVRFMTILLQGFTLLLIWKTIAEKSPNVSKVVLFFIVSASLVMFQVYGFVTTPDVPFLFFATLFLFCYKRFLKKESYLNAFLLALSMAGMVYSKYHAFLIIGLIFLSNIRLLSRYKIWLSGLLALLLLAPHFYWQISNDFPSFQYHLSDRSSSFKWRYFYEYLPNQLAVFNPFTFGAIVYILIKYKSRDVFERGLYFLIIGFIVFFWIMSFRGHVEPHWTVICSIPMIILLYCRSRENQKLMRYVKTWITCSLLLILIARILLAAGLLPEKLAFNGKKEKSEAIESIAGELPVVFTGSFQGPSNYHFFTGKESFVISAINSRQTQFDLWRKELNQQGKPVFICQQNEEKSKEYLINGRSFQGYFINAFQSVNHVKIAYNLPETALFPGDTITVPFVIHNPANQDIDFHHPELPVTWKAAYLINGRKGKIDYADCQLAESLPVLFGNQTVNGTLTTIVPNLPPAEYQFTLTLVNSFSAARNSNYVMLKIINK